MIWWILYALAALLLADALKTRARLSALQRLTPSDEPVAPTHRFLLAPDVTLDAATRQAASAFATAKDLEVLHLVPATATVDFAWGLAMFNDPKALREKLIAPGATGGHAVLVSQRIWELLELDAPTDLVTFVEAERSLKNYAVTASDLALAPTLAQQQHPFVHRAVMHEALAGADRAAMIAIPLFQAVLVLGGIFGGYAGLAALVAYFLQRPIGLAGVPLATQQLPIQSLLRPIFDLRLLAKLAGASPNRAGAPDPVEVRRPVYTALLKDGIERFFEPRLKACPLCESADLKVRIDVPDLFQSKPGRFKVDACGGCGHQFQNPRLTIEGLDFYYKDFYDGLGEKALDMAFASPIQPYEARARMVLTHHPEPERWLDVGCGHGHFCLIAKTIAPACHFEGLDLSESVEEAARRGWVERGRRGLFTEVAPQIEAQFDVVSMSHYLEHTLDPAAEIQAAATALKDGGHLFIEVPDPTGVFARLLGWLWMPYFQPQHLHLLSRKNLERLLTERGFEVLEWHLGAAHHQHDFVFAAYLFFKRFAPTLNVPWRPKSTALQRARNGLVWTIGTGPILGCLMIDLLFGPAAKKAEMTSTYRMLAKKR